MKKYIDATLRKLKTIVFLLWNKLPLMAVSYFVHDYYNHLPEKMPYAELIYAGNLVLDVTLGALILRLLVFTGAAAYGELGELSKDTGLDADASNSPAYKKFTPALVHYWIVTTLCVWIVLRAVTAMQGTGS